MAEKTTKELIQDGVDATNANTIAQQEGNALQAEGNDLLFENLQEQKLQTQVMTAGFQGVIGALEDQSRMLADINNTMKQAVTQIAGLRQDIFASVKDREKLEAKSKIERAESLLAAEMYDEANQLILDAVQLNPADFFVWYTQLTFHIKAVNEEEAETITVELATAKIKESLERCVKLFPEEAKGSEAFTLGILFMNLALILQDNKSLKRSVNIINTILGGSSAPLGFTSTGISCFTLLSDNDKDDQSDLVATSTIQLVDRNIESAEPVELLKVYLELQKLKPKETEFLAAKIMAHSNGMIEQIQKFSLDLLSIDEEWPEPGVCQRKIGRMEKTAGIFKGILQRASDFIDQNFGFTTVFDAHNKRIKSVLASFDVSAWNQTMSTKQGRPDEVTPFLHKYGLKGFSSLGRGLLLYYIWVFYIFSVGIIFVLHWAYYNSKNKPVEVSLEDRTYTYLNELRTTISSW